MSKLLSIPELAVWLQATEYHTRAAVRDSGVEVVRFGRCSGVRPEDVGRVRQALEGRPERFQRGRGG
jgi:hypothetical protein